MGERESWRTMRRSTSQRRCYRSCGYKYLHRYAQGWAAVQTRGTYAFGDVMQQIADLITTRRVTKLEVIEEAFLDRWALFERDTTRTWTSRAPWPLLRERGKLLARLMLEELPPRIAAPSMGHLNERLVYSCAGVEELAIPDHYGLVQRMDGTWSDGFLPTVLDYKTAERPYEETAAELDEQLTDYQLAEEAQGRPVAQVGLVVLIYGAKPRIQWLLTPARSREECDHFIAGAQWIDKQIREGVFIRDERACHTMGACEYIPLCYGSQRHRIAGELRQRDAGATAVLDHDAEGL